MQRALVERAIAGDHDAFSDLARASIRKLYAATRWIGLTPSGCWPTGPPRTPLNTVRGGADAVRIIGGEPELRDNDIEGAAGTAIAASGGAQPRIADNRLCDDSIDFDLPEDVAAAVTGTRGCSDEFSDYEVSAASGWHLR